MVIVRVFVTCSGAQTFSGPGRMGPQAIDRKSTRLNSSHGYISYAVFCLKKKLREASCDTHLIIVSPGFVKYLCLVVIPKRSNTIMVNANCSTRSVQLYDAQQTTASRSL